MPSPSPSPSKDTSPGNASPVSTGGTDVRDRFRAFLAAQRLPLLVGLLMASLSVILLQRERNEWQAAAGAGPQRAVLVLTRNVPAGQSMDAKSMESAMVPVPYVHPLALSVEDREIAATMLAAHDLRAGQAVLWSDVIAPGSGSGEMAGLVRPNERAISLRVNEVSGVGRLIRNNDHVDIFGTFNRPDGSVVTVPILQNVVVVATGQTMQGRGADYSTLSVSVSPQEAALLTLAQETGRLTYVLRNNMDWETVPDLQRVSLDDLFEDSRRKAAQEQRNIRVVKGKL